MRPRERAVTLRNALLVATALVAVFAAIAVSVVRERDSLDPAVEASFLSAFPRGAVPGAVSEPLGCRKTSLSFYDCMARVRVRRRAGFGTVHYRLWLKEDGCWTTTITSPRRPPPGFVLPRGCIAT